MGTSGQPGRDDEAPGTRLPLPLRLVARAAGRTINPHVRLREDRLRDAVQGRVVLLTGASFGLGEATAHRLASAGATVLLVARSAEKLEEVRTAIAADGGDAAVYPADLTDPAAVDALVAAVLADHGHVDVVVSNAGKSIRRSIELSYDRFHDFERTIGTNYLGPVKLLLALLPSMRERGSGHIVNVSTVGVRVPPGPRWAAYQASKTAFDVFLRSAALECRDDGITTTSVYMSLIHTRMSAPTPSLRYLPGLSPREAADLVCTAIVDRPRVISPWWAGAAEVAFSAARWPWEVLAGLSFRHSRDTRAALGGVAWTGQDGRDDESDQEEPQEDAEAQLS